MKNFKIGEGWSPAVYIDKCSRNFISYDTPDTYINVGGEWVQFISGSCGTLTMDYCELGIKDQKKVLDFITESAKTFYQWCYTWPSSKGKPKNLEKDVDNFVARLYKNTFGRHYEKHLEGLNYKPMVEKDYEWIQP